MDVQGKSQLIIETLGCGRFQVIHFFCVGVFSLAALTSTNQLMAFGNYNPGWRCLDPHNGTINGDKMTTLLDATRGGISGLGTMYQDMSVINDTSGINNNVTSLEYSLGDCSVFESCKNVEFNPEAFTIVTEWGLVCSKAWIPSFIISLQMAGFLIGSTIAGIMGDMYGRKFVTYLSMTITVFFDIIAAFSSSWQMFATLRFLLGISMSFAAVLFYVYMAEFVTIKWRAIVMGSPCYPMRAICFGILCNIFKNWRHINIAVIVIGAIGLMPALWLPESLRWLEVKNKTQKFQQAAQRIAKCNNKPLPTIEQRNVETKVETEKTNIKDMFRNILKLFKKEYRKCTIVVTFPWFAVSLIYYAISFGVKDLSGSYYLNIILFYAIEIVVDCVLMFAPDAFGRKKAGVASCLFSGICLLVASCFQQLVSGNARIYGVTIPVMVGRISISFFWTLLQVFMVELYPTVVRGAANSWGLLIARVGGVMAPVLIPTEPDTVFICYAIMGVLAIICALLITLLPETRGTILKERYGDRSFDESEGNARNRDENDEALL